MKNKPMGLLTSVLRRFPEDPLIQQKDEKERRPTHTHITRSIDLTVFIQY